MDAAAKRQAARAKTAANLRLYEGKAGNIKAARPKKPKQVKKAAFSPPARGGERPEDKYGVRNRRRSRKSEGKNSLSVSRDRRAASSGSLIVAA